MKRALTTLLALASLSACSVLAPYAVILHRDGADLIVPNEGAPFLEHWGLTIDGTADYATDAQGQAWCPQREVLKDGQGQPFVRLSCDMPALTSGAQRRIVTVAGSVKAAQGFAYRADAGKRPIPLTLP